MPRGRKRKKTMTKADWMNAGLVLLVVGQLAVFFGSYAIVHASSMKKAYAKRVAKVADAAPVWLSSSSEPVVSDRDAMADAVEISRQMLKKGRPLTP